MVVMYACQRWGLKFADDSYGAYRNRSHRQVGQYKRSSSAAAVLPSSSSPSQPPPRTPTEGHPPRTPGEGHPPRTPTEGHPPRTPAESQATFSDHKLSSHSWNSDSQLRAKRRADPHGGAVGGAGVSVAASSEQPGSVQTFRADSGSARGGAAAAKMFKSPQPLALKPQLQGLSEEDGRSYAARPFQAGGGRAIPDRNDRGVSPEQPQSVKERISNLERKSSFSSSSSSSTPSSVTSPQHTANSTPSGVRWASAAPYNAEQRSPSDIKPQSVTNSSNNHHVPKLSSSVLTTDSPHKPTDSRPLSGSFMSPGQEPSTQSSINARPRAYSEHAKQVSPLSSAEPKPHQRYAEESPTDNGVMPGHAKRSPQSPTERPRSTSSPYNRRESVPAPHIPVITLMSPRRKSEGSFLQSHDERQKDNPPEPVVGVIHGRQPSQEELECDLRAKELAREVATSEKKLSDVLSNDASRRRMHYMDGLFSGPSDFVVKTPVSVRRHQSQGSWDGSQLQQKQPQRGASPTTTAVPASSPESMAHKRNSLPREYFVSPPKAVLEMEWRNKEESSPDLTSDIHDSQALVRQKEDLIEKLMKKLDLLKEERKGLQQEIQEIEDLGTRLCDTVESKCKNPSEREKFNTYVCDLEKIVRLLLNLSGQLARAENAMQSLADDADPEVKKRTLAKRERLQVKHAEAKQLKEDIDKRSDTVSAFLRQSLTPEELNDYAYFVKMKSKLTIELQELEDKITLGQEQIQELRKSIPERLEPGPPSSASPVSPSSSSPASSPVPSS